MEWYIPKHRHNGIRSVSPDQYQRREAHAIYRNRARACEGTGEQHLCRRAVPAVVGVSQRQSEGTDPAWIEAAEQAYRADEASARQQQAIPLADGEDYGDEFADEEVPF